jgi:hypothetical protein
VRIMRAACVLAAVLAMASAAPASAAGQPQYDWTDGSPFEACTIRGAAAIGRAPLGSTTVLQVGARTDLVSGCTGRSSPPQVGLALTCEGFDASGQRVWSNRSWEDTPYGRGYGEIYRTGSVSLVWTAPMSVTSMTCTARHIAATEAAKDVSIFSRQDSVQV